MYSVSIVIPTLNERPNIDILIERISQAASAGKYQAEILFVDDGSTDGTRECIRTYENKKNIRLLCRNNERGLSGAVLAGAEKALSEIVVVMDADLSHPPEKIKHLLEPLQDGSHDMVIGSRYTEGGSTPDWPVKRRISSKLATIPASLFTEAKDPMAGFFAVHRSRLLDLKDSSSAIGFKIGLEILAAGGSTLRIAEIPIVFHDRTKGSSKMSGKVIGNYLQQLLVLTGFKPVSINTSSLKSLGLTGIVTDLLLFSIFCLLGANLATAHVSSFLIAICTCLLLHHFLVERSHLRRIFFFSSIALLSLVLRGGLLSILSNILHWAPYMAILPTIAFSTLFIYLGTSFNHPANTETQRGEEHKWRNFGLSVIFFTVFIRLLYLGTAELLQEEAYYWNYAQHMDIGYLDHPPMVAVLVWLGTSIFGDSAFGIRFGSFFCWFITAYFGFALASSMFNRAVGFRAILLLAILPIFAGSALIITPDSSLVAAWAGSLYFLYRALVLEKGRAWLGVGICLGLGMLSKYTIAFLGPAIILFMLMDKQTRKWFVRPQPYLAALLALLFFSPVIIWNAQHQWASFFFQSQGRIAEESLFSTHLLFGSIMLLLTPTGFLAALAILLPSGKDSVYPLPSKGVLPSRNYLFCTTMTLVPLSLFFLFSLAKEIKLNWTGPLWLGLIPLMAYSMIPMAQQAATPLLQWSQRLWKPTIIFLMLGYGCALHYLALGLPGLNYLKNPFLFGFTDLARQMEDIVTKVEKERGARPLVVGMDKYKIASGLTYYRHGLKLQSGSTVGYPVTDDTTGAHIFTYPSLMFKYWFPSTNAEGRDIIVLSEAKWPMKEAATQGLVKKHGKIHQLTTTKNGKEVGTFYYRLVSGYHAPKVK